jgi:hypothetical protein
MPAMSFWYRVYCLRTADKAPDTNIERYSLLRDLQEKQRADERTRTADLLITSLLAYILACPTASGFPPIYAVFDDLAVSLCPLRTSLY